MSNINSKGSVGTAIGTGNRVTVIKKDERHIHHHGSAGDDKEFVGIAVSLVLLAASVIAASSYLFALYADQVYWALKGAFFLEFVLVVAAGWWEARETNDWPSARLLVLMLLTAGATIGGHFVHVGYGSELRDFATSAGDFSRFWCGLREEWRQFAFLHVLTAGFGLALGVATLVLPISQAVRQALGGSPAVGWGSISVATLVIGGAIALHTDFGAAVATKLPVPRGLFCAR